MTPTQQQPFYIRFTAILLMLLLAGFIIRWATDIIVPFALSILLAIVLIPINKFLEKRKIPRVYAIAISLVISFLLIFGVIYFLSTQILNFLDDIPEIKKRLNGLIHDGQLWAQKRFGISTREQSTYFKNAKGSGSSVIGTTFVSLKDTFLLLSLLPIYTFLILYYRDMLKRFLVDIFKGSNRERVEDILRESKGVIQNYMVGLMIEMVIVALINFLGFTIIGIDYAIFLAVFAAVLNLIPYIGMLIASIFCTLITLTTSEDTTQAVWTLVVLWIVQFFDNNIIMPKVVGSKVKINALFTILGVFLGGALAGISGMFLAIPGIAILKVIFERVDNLKPWGMLLSDDITSNRPGKIYTRVAQLRKKPPLKPPTPVTPVSVASGTTQGNGV
ncbi:MAG TPA: AI-2E family transporter [Flavitalea sp.]|nr:AI-2E family transporter [Flavitalea sp.]